MAGPIVNDDAYSITSGENKQLGYVFSIFGNKFDLSGLPKNDQDEDGDPLEIVSVEGQSLNDGEVTVTGSNGGEFRIFSDGSIFLDATTGFEYLAAGETANMIVTYTVSDGTSSSVASVVVTVTGVDGDSILAQDDVFSTEESTILAGVNVTSNDELYADFAEIVAINGIGFNVGAEVRGSNGGLFTIVCRR
ncbi:MAG: Ig-like domain-containing protein [Oleiphilaceae bacterium]|nr:Ig-like domain-containing protein [Oleiphilaceae bacterium]